MAGGQLWLLANHMRNAVPVGHRACLLAEPILPFKTTCASWLRGPSPIGLSSARVSFRHTHICTTLEPDCFVGVQQQPQNSESERAARDLEVRITI